MLELKNINKDYEIRKGKIQKVLKNLNVSFPSKGFVSILGTSGSGKSTLLNIIGGLDDQDSGEVKFEGVEILNHEEFRRDKVGFVFQDHNLIEHLNAVDNVILGMSDDVENKKDTARKILTDLGLETCLHKKPSQLSGGQKQRVAIARMIAKDVDIIICDEPTARLDEKTAEIVVKIIKELSKDKLVIFVTHHRMIAEKYSDRIINIRNGKVAEEEHSFDYALDLQGRKKKTYDHNTTWLSFKNLIGRKKHTFKHILLIASIMFMAAFTLVMQGEFFKKYLHDRAIEEGIKTVILDIDESQRTEDFYEEFESIEHVTFAAKDYAHTVTLAASNYESTRVDAESALENISGNPYFEEIIRHGRLPENSSEVLMSAHGVISLLSDLGIGGERLYDQYMTGEYSSEKVYDLIDRRKFIVAEYGYPRIKVVGLVDDTMIHEEMQKIYVLDGFDKLFEYPKGLHPTRVKLYKDQLYRDTHKQILEEALSIGKVEANEVHEKKVDIVYNKIESFLELSRIALILIIVIASISFTSLLFNSVFERKYEIGLYRSKGYSKYNISKILGIEMFFMGSIALIVVIISLMVLVTAVFMRLNYIADISEAFEVINLGETVAALTLIITGFISVVIYISNKLILSKSILSNIKDV